MAMSPPPDPAQWDAGNNLLALAVADMTATAIDCSDGVTRLAVTIHTPTTTLTVLLNRDDATSWMGVFKAGIGKMPAIKTAQTLPATGPVPGLPGGGSLLRPNGRKPGRRSQ